MHPPVGAGAAGWTFALGMVAAAALYFCSGALLKRARRGLPGGGAGGGLGGALPHHAFWVELAALVLDGVSFTVHLGRPVALGTATASADATAAVAPGAPAAALLGAGQALRGRTTALHAAAIRGDAKELATLLRAGSCLPLDGGDKRCYTAFHTACAGGHVACARLLLAAGCDPDLQNNVGLTGWALATQLQRAQVRGSA
jgi:hypothetical protein